MIMKKKCVIIDFRQTLKFSFELLSKSNFLNEIISFDLVSTKVICLLPLTHRLACRHVQMTPLIYFKLLGFYWESENLFCLALIRLSLYKKCQKGQLMFGLWVSYVNSHNWIWLGGCRGWNWCHGWSRIALQKIGNAILCLVEVNGGVV